MDSDVQQIKDRINIVDVVGQYVTLRRAGRTSMGRCPFHKERTPSFHVSPERGTYKCFGCGEGGDVFSFLQKIEGADFPTVLKQLAEKAGVKLEPRFARPKGEAEKSERLLAICKEAARFFEQQLALRSDVRAYIHARGVVDASIQAWAIGYAPAEWESLSQHLLGLKFSVDDIVDAGLAVRSDKRPGQIFDRFRGRIMFPISDAGGQVIAFSGRFFEKVKGQKDDIEPAKYINSPETQIFKKSRTLYGYDRAMSSIRKLDCILLVEGQVDLVMAHQSGLPFTVALSGTALTEEHLSRLGRLSKRLVLALDADQAGLRSGLKSAYMAIAEGFEVKVPLLPPGQDPADMARQNPELLKAAVRTSRTAVEFFLDALRPGAKDERGYQRIVEAQVLPLVAVMHSTIEQEHFIRIIARALHVSESAVRAEVQKRPKPAAELPGASPIVHQLSAESTLTPLQKKAGMILCYFGADSPQGVRLRELWGQEALDALRPTLEPMAESLRFRFDAEVGEHTSAEAIAEDMLADIERSLARDRFKMKFL